ncbi:MAG: succinate dehydrogenase assembly factor 2 [Hyphomicrobiales bacterium]|nr:succinate dehydrogenase assembly factor 2 [Hyphomicrobiales bacterium]
MTEPASLETRRKAIRIRAWRRGMREMDILIGSFVDARLDGLDARDVGDLEKLLDAPDQQAFAWLTGAETPPAHWDTPVFRKIVEFHRHDSPLHL